MDKNAILAVMISLGIWVGWQKFYLEPIQLEAANERKRVEEIQKTKAAQLGAGGTVNNLTPETRSGTKSVNQTKQIEKQTKIVKNSVSTVELSNESNFISAWTLDTYLAGEKHDEKTDLKSVTGFNTQLFLRFSDEALSREAQQNWSLSDSAYGREVSAQLKSANIEAVRSFVLDSEGYGATLTYKIRFLSEAPKYIFIDTFGNPKRPNDHEGSIFGQAPDKVHVSYRDINGRHSDIAQNQKEMKETAASVKWVGLDTQYFVLGLVAEEGLRASAGAQLAPDALLEGAAVRASYVFPTDGKKEITIGSKIYFGPKEMKLLSKVDPILADTIDFGWTSFLAIPLLKSLKWFHGFVNNYGLAIILLTFVIKMLLFPLTYKSMKSMAKIAKLQPQLNALREKYKDDKEKLNVEMMSFMKTNGYNPVGGCLPILIQMPIFFALYRVLFNSMELYQAPFMGWIQDLSAPDPFFVTPVLLCGLMFLQQKLVPSTVADPVQQKMLQWMPVMFGMFMLLLPAGLNIYMVVNSAVSIAQQYYLNKKLGITPQQKLATT